MHERILDYPRCNLKFDGKMKTYFSRFHAWHNFKLHMSKMQFTKFDGKMNTYFF